MEKEIKRIKFILFGICLLFFSLIVYLTYFQIVQSDKIKQSTYNKRLWIDEEKTKRGNIEDRNGNILAYSEKGEDTYKRIYKYGNLYSHLIGYSYREYGKVGLELTYNNTLLNISENLSINEIKNIVNPSKIGNDLRLSLDHEVQAYTREKLNGRKGAVVALNPSTGEIYSMVSLPDFNVSKLKEDWTEIMENKDSPFINRATSGLYPPGSTFKILTAIGLVEDSNIDKNYNCQGTAKIDGYTLKDYGSHEGHGNINIKEALTKSCNTYFATKVQELGKDKFLNITDRAMIGNKIKFDIPIKSSSISNKDKLGKTDLSAVAIGQGKLLVTPLNMAMISGAIANDGKMMKPILVQDIVSPKGHVIDTISPELVSDLTDKDTADSIKDMMLNVVENGTGRNAKISGVDVAGKTGTAENASGKNHAWFTGFAPVENPRVAIAVILEEDGKTGGVTAAPVARDIMKFILGKY